MPGIADLPERIEAMSSPHAGDPFKVRADAARLARDAIAGVGPFILTRREGDEVRRAHWCMDHDQPVPPLCARVLIDALERALLVSAAQTRAAAVDELAREGGA